MSTANDIFQPYGIGTQPGAGIAIAASTSSASGTISRYAADNTDSVLVTNVSTGLAFVRWQRSTDTTLLLATSADIPVPAGSAQTFSKTPGCDRFSVILASGSGNVYFTPGHGV